MTEDDLKKRLEELRMERGTLRLLLTEYEKVISRIVSEKIQCENRRGTILYMLNREIEYATDKKEQAKDHEMHVIVARNETRGRFEDLKVEKDELQRKITSLKITVEGEKYKFSLLRTHAMDRIQRANCQLELMRENQKGRTELYERKRTRLEFDIKCYEEQIQEIQGKTEVYKLMLEGLTRPPV